MRQAWWELPWGDEGRACAQGSFPGGMRVGVCTGGALGPGGMRGGRVHRGSTRPWGHLPTQPHKRTRSARGNLHSLTHAYRTNTCCPAVGGPHPGWGYVGVPTSPAGPCPSVCPITAVSRGLKPTLSKGTPKASSFAS